MSDKAPDTQDSSLQTKYKDRGFQKLSLAEYESLQAARRKRKFQLPAPVKYVVLTPFLIMFCFGIFYIPYTLYVIATSPRAKNFYVKEDASTKKMEQIRYSSENK